MMEQHFVHLGFELGTGEPVSIPLAHTFVTGQTQLSGKTTTLRAIVVRSGWRALAFITKRGEQFDGRRIRPFLPREGDRPIHWRLVETIMASALGQKQMPKERWFILNASRGAKSLQAVRDNVHRLQSKSKNPATAEQYELVGEYLDLVLPEMRELNATETLDLAPGLNVMDIGGHSSQLQAMVIRACLEHINYHEERILTVFPEAWEFAPRGRKTPASDEAVAMARKGAVLGNFMLSDSQDIAGVDTTIRQAASVWVLGVQRELNELKRTLAMIPAHIKKPKVADITSLKRGEFIVCWGERAVRTYVQPAWMSDAEARGIARGEIDLKDVREPTVFAAPLVDRPAAPTPVAVPIAQRGKEEISTAAPPAPPSSSIQIESEEEMTPQQMDELKECFAEGFRTLGKELAKLKQTPVAFVSTNSAAGQIVPAGNTVPTPATSSIVMPEEEVLYQRFRERILADEAVLVKVASLEPKIEVTVERKIIECDTSTAEGMIAVLIKEGFFKQPASANAAHKEMERRWNYGGNSGRAYEQCDKFTKLGFLTKESSGDQKGYKSVPSRLKDIKEK